jgi:hypothetical protein
MPATNAFSMRHTTSFLSITYSAWGTWEVPAKLLGIQSFYLPPVLPTISPATPSGRKGSTCPLSTHPVPVSFKWIAPCCSRIEVGTCGTTPHDLRRAPTPASRSSAVGVGECLFLHRRCPIRPPSPAWVQEAFEERRECAVSHDVYDSLSARRVSERGPEDPACVVPDPRA